MSLFWCSGVYLSSNIYQCKGLSRLKLVSPSQIWVTCFRTFENVKPLVSGQPVVTFVGLHSNYWSVL